jgi:peroxiredoxin
VAQLRPRHAELQSLNTKPYIISFGASSLARWWLEDTGVPFTLLLDPRRTAYQAYGLERSLLRSWGVKTFLRYARLLASGRRWRGIQGDSGQLGGDFIVDPQGLIRLAYPSRNHTNRPPVEQLISMLQSIEQQT